MLKDRSFYMIVGVAFLLLVVPNMMFQMRSEAKIFKEEPLLFFGTCLIASFICAFTFFKMFRSPKD